MRGDTKRRLFFILSRGIYRVHLAGKTLFLVAITLELCYRFFSPCSPLLLHVVFIDTLGGKQEGKRAGACMTLALYSRENPRGFEPEVEGLRDCGVGGAAF